MRALDMGLYALALYKHIQYPKNDAEALWLT
jgi:hypothetical protein